jgi:hypothetical protein
MLAKAQADKIEIAELVYPPRVKNLGLWNVQSEISGPVPVEITYLTSGLTWRAFYMGTLAQDEKTMRLQGYVRVTNNSGEDYENAQVRLIVGKVHILDQIADLARREYPYGRPGAVSAGDAGAGDGGKGFWRAGEGRDHGDVRCQAEGDREGGTQRVLPLYDRRHRDHPDRLVEAAGELRCRGRARRQSVQVRGRSVRPEGRAVPELQERPGAQARPTPIPDGNLKVYRSVDDAKHLSYEGQSAFKYIPVNDDVELNLGTVADVVVEPRLMEYKTENYRFDNKGNVSGWDDVQTFAVEVRNTRMSRPRSRSFATSARRPGISSEPATRPASRRSIWTR